MKQVYQIREYGSFITGRELSGYTTLPGPTFNQLEQFVLSNQGKSDSAMDLMGLSAKKGVGKVITAKNYVGVITMKDGTSIEILPKIYAQQWGDKPCQEADAKGILFEMLKTLRNTPYKSINRANVGLTSMSIFEIFIRMFVDEVFVIVKRGLKCSYETVEENQKFFKGRMMFAEQIKHNIIHKERSYVEYDTYSVNRPENRLIKATLRYLYSQSTSMKNKNDIRLALNAFGTVESSADYNRDFSRVTPDRHTKDYVTALAWSRIFLMGKSLTSFHGSDVAIALLFPMQTLFERYIAEKLRNALNSKEFSVSMQDKSYHLFDLPTKKFMMKPDIVVRRNADDAVFVLDTKWKILSDKKSNYGISQGDMYQMYAYQKKYGAKQVVLVYPQTPLIVATDGFEFSASDGVQVCAKFVDLLDIDCSIEALAQLVMDRRGVS